MTYWQIAIVVLMVSYSIYRQTKRQEVIGSNQFKLAIIYGIVGVAVGGLDLPHQPWQILFLAISLSLSVGVGIIRGRCTRVWAVGGRVYSQGTVLTVALFLLLVLTKAAMGTAAYFAGAAEPGGFGEILLMISLMVAFQAEIIWRRAQPLEARRTGSPTKPGFAKVQNQAVDVESSSTHR